MAADKAGFNLLLVSGTEFLLVETAGTGSAVHLARGSESDAEARAAIPFVWVEDEEWPDYRDLARRYDLSLLTEPRWSERTLCGREWLDMAGGDGGPLTKYGLDAVAPSCRRCLASLDSLFPAVEPDDRVELVSQLAVEAVCKTGGAHIKHVPGDQIEALRRVVRKAIRERLGFGSSTFVIESRLHVVCTEAYEAVKESQMQRVAAALERAFAGEEPIDDPEHVISWRTWG